MFSDVVALYRKIGCPRLGADLSVEVTLAKDGELERLRRQLDGAGGAFGVFQFEEIDEGKSLAIEANFPSGSNRFVDTVANFVRRTPSLAKGEVGENFYIIEADFASTDGDDARPEEIKAIYRAANFIADLKRFSLSASNTEDLGDVGKIFFLQSAKSHHKSLVIPLKFSEELLSVEIEGGRILKHLSGARDKLHMEERQLIMSVAICDVARDAPPGTDLVLYLARHWREVKRKYKHDLSAYVRNFAFEGERKKIADAAIEYSAKLNTALGEMTGKILVAPISVAAMLALSKVESERDYWAGVLGVLIAFVVYRVSLKNQQKQVARLNRAYDFVLAGLLKKKATFDPTLRDALNKFEEEAEDQKTSLRRAIATYWVVAYLPVVAVVLVTVLRYSGQLTGALKLAWSCI